MPTGFIGSMAARLGVVKCFWATFVVGWARSRTIGSRCCERNRTGPKTPSWEGSRGRVSFRYDIGPCGPARRAGGRHLVWM